MTENEKYMIPEVYYNILNLLKVSYLNYADEKNINLCDSSTEFGKKYRMIIEAKNSIMRCDIEKEQKNYQNIIESSKKYLISIGGRFVG